MTKIQELELELAKQKARAETWEQAFRLVSTQGIPVSEEHVKKVGKRKATIENYEEGKNYALKHILPNINKDEEPGAVGVQNAWLAAAANWIREQVVEYAVGLLIQLVKENAIKAADWLLSQTEDVLLKGFDRLNDEDKSLLKNDMKQYPRFAELLKKIEERENK